LGLKKNSNLYHPVYIDSLEIPGNLFLAPLAGYTDPAFRQICIEAGANFTYTEMVSAEAISRNNPKTIQLMRRNELEALYGIQVFSSSVISLSKSLSLILCLKPSLIDLNCGCPVPKIVKTGAGSALLKTPEKIFKIIQMIKNITDIPVTVKIRSGWDSNSINFLETAKAAEEGGAGAVCLHPRTKSQGYSGEARWDYIKDLVQTLNIPVFGSGDLKSPSSAKEMLEVTGCSAVMFARGAIGNPFIFRETQRLLKHPTQTDDISIFSFSDRLETAFRHLTLLSQYKNEETACKEMRKHFCAYTKGVPGGGVLRNKIIKATSIKHYKEICSSFKHDIELD
jgi:tRNA-dihydrouridine synthase B